MARVICPACKQPGNVPDEFLGQRIKCLTCGGRFTAERLPTFGELTDRARARGQEHIETASMPALRATSMPRAPVPAERQVKACYFCGEEILIGAKKCKHCGEIVDPTLRAAEEARRHPPSPPPLPAPPVPFERYDRPNPPMVRPQVIQQTVVVRTGGGYRVPHVLHFCLTFLTCGLWLPIWVIHALVNAGNGRE
jgi:hypothetical protein